MVDKKLHIIGESGNVLGPKDMNAELKRSDLANNKDLLKIFDYYNKDKDGKSKEVLDKTELNNMLSELLASSNGDNIFEPDEIRKHLEGLNLGRSVATDDMINFLGKISVNSLVQKIYDDIDGMGTSSSLDDHLEEIPIENITEVLKKYKKDKGESLAQAISNESGSWGSTRNNYLRTIRDKLAERGNQVGVDSKAFIKAFDKELSNMDMSWMSGEDSSQLDKVIDSYMNKLAKPEKIYNQNKDGIMQMMSNKDLCCTDEDRNEIFNKIMKYSTLNNPKSMIEDIAKTSKTPAIKSSAQKLLKSKYLDYFPIFVASIVAQETQFRQFDDGKNGVFTENGKGVMQLTRRLLEDMYQRPGIFDDAFIERIKEKYENSAELYNAIQNREDSSLNFDVGTAGLKGKLDTVLKEIPKGTYSKLGINVNSPEVLMELIAYNYNGNSAPKKDKKYNYAISQMRYVYAREVLLRFKQYTPEGVSVRHYFEYNPKTNKFINH